MPYILTPVITNTHHYPLHHALHHAHTRLSQAKATMRTAFCRRFELSPAQCSPAFDEIDRYNDRLASFQVGDPDPDKASPAAPPPNPNPVSPVYPRTRRRVPMDSYPPPPCCCCCVGG